MSLEMSEGNIRLPSRNGTREIWSPYCVPVCVPVCVSVCVSVYTLAIARSGATMQKHPFYGCLFVGGSENVPCLLTSKNRLFLNGGILSSVVQET